MFKMEVDQVVCMFVEEKLPRSSSEKDVLTMSFRLVMRETRGNLNKGPLKHGRKTVRMFALMFHRPGNYTKVMWVPLSGKNFRIKENTQWTVLSNHDSCWRTDGVRDIFDKIWKEMAVELGYAEWVYHPRVRLDAEVRFDICGEPERITLKNFVYDREKRTFTVEF